jgi:acetyl-CoA carboxylase biotin carboxyl carrier protein
MPDHVVHAPFPGIFYRRPDPDSDPFVKESDAVEEGAVIGLIEVMKMFQEVRADAGGTVAEFLVDNESAVDAGQPLLRLS